MVSSTWDCVPDKRGALSGMAETLSSFLAEGFWPIRIPPAPSSRRRPPGGEPNPPIAQFRRDFGTEGVRELSIEGTTRRTFTARIGSDTGSECFPRDARKPLLLPPPAPRRAD